MKTIEEAIVTINQSGEYSVVPIEYDENRIDEDLLFEMANVWKADTGLPMNIWLDDSDRYKKGGHWMRIKFQLNTSDKNDYSNTAPIDLNGVVRIKLPDHVKLSGKDFQALRNWIRNNKYALELVMSKKLSLMQIFPFLIRGGNLASEEELNKLKAICDAKRLK